MPNSKQRIAKQKQRKRLARQRTQRLQELSNAKTKTINEMFKDGSLPKELENRVTLRKGK
jgi:hypothetical protein|tara:strand:+ start:302 stop:481 length:180 start_codon:yes stop_codon:yes gene_type:complete